MSPKTGKAKPHKPKGEKKKKEEKVLPTVIEITIETPDESQVTLKILRCMFFINVDRSSNNPRFEAQTHRTQPQQFALTVLHQSQRSLFFINLEANRVRTRHQMVQTPISSFITASTADLMSSSLVHFSFSTFSLSNGSGWKLDFRINLFQWEQEVLNNLLQSLSMSSISRGSEDCLIWKGEIHGIF